MILYHGSNVEIVKIDLSKSMRGKDFGQGFYLSAYREHGICQPTEILRCHHYQQCARAVGTFH